MGGFAWVTLATNDSYSLGALVLGHSLRRVGTPHDLVVLVTPGVSAAMRNQLSSAFTVVQEVNVLDSQDEANLALLERPELGITFTKLHCWRLTQYEKCVFLDADTLVLKNSDELFEREELSAAPDPGWPDCFNSGVFVYRPSLDTFSNLIKFALSKGSFDGGDQGLLNLYFSDWATKDISRHLPFLYNMVSTATYSYLPAYKAFGEDAKIAHFIGPNKPWLQYFDPETRLVRPPQGSEHLQHLLQLWWDIFCSTVHPSLSPDMAHCSSNGTQAGPAPQTVSHFSIDLFQKFQPMSIYSEYQPISVSPYVEDLSLSFFDPWENYEERSKDTKCNDRSSRTTLRNYHGSEQQCRAFENDKRQSGWQRYTDGYQDTQHNVMSSAETFHTQPHHSSLSACNNASSQSLQYHSQQSYEQSLPHQSYQHSHFEGHHHTEPDYHHESHYQPELHAHHQEPHYHHESQYQSELHTYHQETHQHEPHNQTEMHPHKPHYHHESQYQSQLHTYHQETHQHEPHNQTEMHPHKPHYHHEPQRQAEPHDHEPHNQPEPHYQEPQSHHKPHNETQEHHQQHYHHKSPHNPETHYEQQHHGEKRHHSDQREHHNQHQSHNQQQYHWHNSSQHQHHNQDHQHEYHQCHDTQHEQDTQYRNTVHNKETHQVCTVSSAPWERQNQQNRHGDHQDHQPHPDPPHPASYISSTVSNSEYIKVTNEPHCLVARPVLEVESSKAADNDLGLAGALAQVTLGVPRSAEQTAFEEHVRKQAWEQGSVDYMGRDSFDNIWRKITDTLAQAPPKPVPHKAVTEVTTTKPTSEPTLPEPKSTTLSPTGAGDASAITSSTATLDSEPSPPKSTDPSVPSVPLGGLTPSPFPGEQPVPRTPSVTEATPPTSPPIVVPTADSKALKVDVEPLETPPVGSTPTKLLSEEQVPSPATQVTQVSESHLQTETTSVAQQEVGSAVLKELGPVQETEAREQEKVPSSPQQTVPTQEVPEALVPSETKSSEAVLVSQQTLPAQESPVAPSTPQPPPIPEVPVTPSIPQEAPTQGSPVVPVGLSTPEQSPIPGVPVTPSVPQVPPTQEGPVAQSTSQPTPTTERSVSPVILSTSEPSPVPEVPVTPSIPEVSSTQESHSASVPLSTPEPTHTQRSPAAPPTPQQTSTQDAPAVPVFPQQPSSAQDSSAAIVVPPTPQQSTPTQETLAAPVSKPVEQNDPPSIQQQLPPTPPASPGTVGTKPSEASPEKTEVKPTEQKESPLAPIRVEQPKDSTIPQTQEAVQQKAAASAPPLLPSQEVPVSTTTNKTPAISQTKPVEETPVPQLAIIKDQTVAAPVSPSPVPLPSAEMETIPLAVSVPAESASETPPSPMPLSKSKESPKASTIAEPVHEEATPTVPSKTEPSFVRDAPEREREMRPVGEKGAIVPPTQSKPAEPSKPVPSEPLSPPSTPDTSSSDQASVPSAQSKPEEPSKSVPSKPLAPASPPTTGDASPSDQAPVPPKRRGHKAAGTSTPDQGAATKPVAQSQQGKGSKQVQKGKK